MIPSNRVKIILQLLFVFSIVSIFQWPLSAKAQVAGTHPPVTSSLMVPIATSVRLPPDPCHTAGDTVTITGNLHLLAIVETEPPDPCIVGDCSERSILFRVQPIQLTGAGSSGATYRISGTTQMSFREISNFPPLAIVTVLATTPPDPCIEATPLGVSLRFSYNVDGSLSSAAFQSINPLTQPAPAN